MGDRVDVDSRIRAQICHRDAGGFGLLCHGSSPKGAIAGPRPLNFNPGLGSAFYCDRSSRPDPLKTFADRLLGPLGAFAFLYRGAGLLQDIGELRHDRTLWRLTGGSSQVR